MCEPADLQVPGTPAAYAVVSSGDSFDSSAVGLLDAQGGLLTEALIDSGTTEPGLSTTLHEDISLPTQMPVPGELTIVSRLRRNTITQIDLDGEGAPSGSEAAEPSAATTAYASAVQWDVGKGLDANPQDAALGPDGRLWVTRYERNPQYDDVPELERGNDLIAIDLDTGGVEGRIPLDSLNFEVDGVLALARPAQVLRVGEVLVVGLDLLSDDFRVAARGHLALVNVGNGEVDSLGLDERLRNCGSIARIPGTDSDIMVLCKGETFSSTEERRESSGFVRVRVDAANQGASIVDSFLASASEDLPLPYGTLMPLGGPFVMASTLADARSGGNRANSSSEQPAAQLVLFNMETSSAEVLLSADSELRSRAIDAFGRGTYDRQRGMALVPDATRGILHFSVSSEAERGQDFRPTLVGTVNPSPCRGMSVRQVSGLVPHGT